MTYGSDPETAAGVREGEVLAGKYRVDKILGVGGMGVVVAAHHLHLDSRVAIKFLLPEMLRNQEAVIRFTREAKAAAKIASEHVARVLDVGVLETRAPYMVMEFLEGEDLGQWLRLRGPLPVEQAVDFVLQACVAVAEAHGIGIVHRDLKPDNLFCVRRQDGQFQVKVLDFGISKISDPMRASEPPGMSVTKTTAVMGSPLYMSPEQMQSAKQANAQSDIWALGVTLFHLLSGHVPFDGESAIEIAVKIAMHPPVPLRSVRTEVPSGLEAVVLRCLAKRPEDRYPNVAELAIALADFAPKRSRSHVERIAGTIQAAGLSVSALNVPPSPPLPQRTLLSIPPPAQDGGTQMPLSATRSPSLVPTRRTVGLIGAGGATALLAVVGIAALLARSGSDHAASPPIGLAPSVAASPDIPAPESPRDPTPAPAEGTELAAKDAGGGWIVITHSASSAPIPPPPRTTPTPTAMSPSTHAVERSTTAASPTPRVPMPPLAAPQPETIPRPACDPPYVLDDQGNKHFKPECFLGK